MAGTEAASQVVVYYTFLSLALKFLAFSDEDEINKNVMVAEASGNI